MKRRVFLPALFAAACSRRKAPFESFNTVPDFTLTDQTGAEFRSADHLKGKVWVADFIFTTCTGPCPRMSSQMKQVQAGLADLADARFVSFTVDPANDTPAALAAYAKRYVIDPARWWFLTGPQETLHGLNREVFMLGNVLGNLDHSTRFVLIDRKGTVRRYYETTEPDAVSQVIEDVRELAAS